MFTISKWRTPALHKKRKRKRKRIKQHFQQVFCHERERERESNHKMVRIKEFFINPTGAAAGKSPCAQNSVLSVRLERQVG